MFIRRCIDEVVDTMSIGKTKGKTGKHNAAFSR